MVFFDWQCWPEAEKWLYGNLDRFKEKNPFIADLEKELFEKTSTRLFDWIDHFALDFTEETELKKRGFAEEFHTKNYKVFFHPGAKLPTVVLAHKKNQGIALKSDSIAEFLMMHGRKRPIEGSLLSSYRSCLVREENHTALWTVERRGARTMDPVFLDAHHPELYLEASEKWLTRARHEETLENPLALVREIVGALDKDMAAWIVCECERKFWQAKNTAAQIQKNRQDQLGLGWANHDHHTFRSSRKNFSDLVLLFEILGFQCRERFYAGAKAGWGAQVMENPVAGLILFLDVDLAPEEVEIDFAHEKLEETQNLGTVGLWCGLHGDSILHSGMHHLEAQFSFDKLKEDLAGFGIKMMDPFTDFSYLRQAFTAAQRWSVDPARVALLLKKQQITQEQAKEFLSKGAIGSHLENLQRDEGYKGFNKEGVNAILKKTDPRLKGA